ncbi:MAG: hypothetical protein CVV27_19290 [Candidatus Melainabacteria bacterium HGW-Melainabacteria-1]|nr:MAG: hypothetical protein CVV27_19290 [Candidatus Melainabacteria bacterium HGW-Melainabacteria-1]
MAFVFTVLAGNDVRDFQNIGGAVGGFTGVATGNQFVLEVRSTVQGTSTTTGGELSIVDRVAYFLLGTGDSTGSDVGSFSNVNVNLLTAFGAGNAITFDGGATGTLSVSVNTGDLLSTAATAGPASLRPSDIGKTATIQVTGQRAAIAEDNALTFQVGANEGQYLKMGVQDMRARALRMEGLNLVGADDAESRARAQNAIGVVDQALEYVNTVRSRLGAMQNRVEYRIANLQVSRENLTASESRIRDTDFAAETANLTRAQILIQAGTAVLTQANISPQSALNLL